MFVEHFLKFGSRIETRSYWGSHGCVEDRGRASFAGEEGRTLEAPVFDESLLEKRKASGAGEARDPPRYATLFLALSSFTVIVWLSKKLRVGCRSVLVSFTSVYDFAGPWRKSQGASGKPHHH